MYASDSVDRQDFQVTNVTPQYNPKELMGGYFNVTIGLQDGVDYHLAFGAFISFLFKNDEKLKDYVVNHMKRDETGVTSFSDVIRDLYSIGYPIEEKVASYVQYVGECLPDNSFQYLLLLFKMMKGFNEDEKL